MKVLIIRSTRKALELKNLFNEHGFTSAIVSLVEIGAIDASAWQAQFQKALHNHLDGLIFVSLNAVDYFMRNCADFDAVKNVPCFAVGSGTGDELISFGFKHVSYPRKHQGSEALLELPELQKVQGKNFMIVRGTNGRELIGETLEARGAHVEGITVYTNGRRILSDDEVEILQQDYDAIVVSSTEALRYLLDLKTRLPLPKLTQAALVVMSERQEKIAGLEDFKTFIHSSSVNNNEVLTSLSNYRKLKLTH